MFALPQTFTVTLTSKEGSQLFTQEIDDYEPLHALERVLYEYQRNLHDPRCIATITIHVEP